MKTITSLNGIWKFAPTHDQRPNNNHNVVSVGIPLYAHPSLIRSNWESVEVPGVWQKYAEKYSVYEGVCWYFREFDLADVSSGSFVNLVFKGVNYRAEVYINGQYVGEHESAYTEFFFDISSFVNKGKNTIAVQVDNRPLIVKWPNDWGYGVYGGIYRDVFVEVYNEAYLFDTQITPDYDVDGKKGILTLSGKTTENVSSVRVKLGADTRSVECHDGQFSARLEYDFVSAWSPDHPALYPLCLSIGEESYRQCKVGFRHVACADRAFLLNGQRVQMNGACYVYDSPKYGLVMARTQLEQDLLKMKEANVNAIRTHYPMSDDFYELCDEMGFMVWIEPNVYCSKPADEQTNTVFKQKPFVDVAVSMTQEMIYAARRFASVVIYGIGNECNTDHPEAVPFFRLLSDTVRSLDSTRLVGFATLYGGWLNNIVKVIDIVGINAYYGWYGGPFSVFGDEDSPEEANGAVKIREADVSELNDTIKQVLEHTDSSMPLLITEFGADSVPGYRSRACEVWSENYHAKVVKAVVELTRNYPEVNGTFVFAFTDYLDPSKPLNGRWNGFNLKGMLTYDRDYKLPFYALQEAYAREN